MDTRSSHGSPARRAGAGFSGPVDLPIPEWARKTAKPQRPGLLASIRRDADEEKDELAATSASLGGRNHIDHNNVPVRWLKDKGAARTGGRADSRFQRQRIRKLKGGTQKSRVGPAPGAAAEESKQKAARSVPESDTPSGRRLASLKSGAAATEVTLLLQLMGKDALTPEETLCVGLRLLRRCVAPATHSRARARVCVGCVQQGAWPGRCGAR